ncbi:hypothetical protein CANCADRAFT_2074 [Tortispora caseinolytica NRRL Y-17796]|uniref:Peptidase M20 dimerisation domain-containing protein n=1 Tax=Tortispora caseinolytica NRRL Y-17796 TaxID=767744 RepID=A0A1E4TF65_9ASCO|nr:hypothetical protein CANCADRAFT_2074 [Tortispora caseinolytica NRRL Y-17796]
MTIDLKINADRLNKTLHDTCTAWGQGTRWGTASTETGMKRLALSPEDGEVRRWLVAEAKKLGCEVTIDAMGNIFCVLAGRNAGTPTMMGSHLDTVPTGGRYDGILGVQAGLEVLRSIKDAGYIPNYPVGLVDWTNEEGARFPFSMVSSGVWAGEVDLERAYALADVHDKTKTISSCLDDIGFKGETECSYKAMPFKAHFELHIEQGPILEAAKQKVGIVQGVQAYNWFTVTVSGRPQHTGTTPFAARADSMLASARFIAKAHEIASAHDGLVSTGIFGVEPGAVNVLPETTQFSIDMRHVEDDELALIEAETWACLDKIVAATPGLSYTKEPIIRSPAVKFNQTCIDCVTKAAETAVGADLCRPMTSGAGHDSCYTSLRCPTTMIFVPSKGGISHNPVEYTSPEDCAIGAQVLLGAVVDFDSRRSD